MKDSIVGDQWLYQCATNVHVQRIINPDTGQPTGDILTGPVRLTFPHIFEPQKTKPGENPGKFGACLLFTPWADFTIMREEVFKLYAAVFADKYNPATQQYYGLHDPFHDQAEKSAQYAGFTPGLQYISVSTKFKPQVVDARGNPIVDPAKVYPGVWAICSINAYTFKDKKSGVSFGLQSVMLIGDDTKLGGGAPDPAKTYGGVMGAIAPPPVQAGAMAGMPPSAPPAAPPAHMPPPPAGGTYAAPPGAPPAPAGYNMPGQPVPPAPPAVDPRGPAPQGYGSWAEYDADMASL